jgi:6-phosphogluconolactonase
MKSSAIGLTVALCLGIVAPQTQAADKTDLLVYIGTHGTGGGGPPPATPPTPAIIASQGIYAARFNTRTGHLTGLGQQIELQRATWLVTNTTLPVIYTGADGGGGFFKESGIYSYTVDRSSGKLKLLNKVGSGGLDATHMALDAGSKTMFVANHGSGDVTALPLMKDGSVGTVVSDQKNFGKGPTARQSTPAPHSVAIDPSRRYVLSADFGADRVFVYHFAAAMRALTPAETPFEAIGPGTGPRHLVFSPNGKFVYLNAELSGDLRVLQWDAGSGRLHVIQTVSPYAADYSGVKSAAEIAISRDGRFVYVSLRGDQNSILVYTVNKSAGTLTELQRIPSGGIGPWSFELDPTGRWLLSANEGSGTVTVLAVDKATGRLSPTSESISVPSPVALTFVGN